jgi:hypothetical protein
LVFSYVPVAFVGIVGSFAGVADVVDAGSDGHELGGMFVTVGNRQRLDESIFE